MLKEAVKSNHQPQRSTTPQELARLVLGYLQRHPKAEETIEGIAQWWILDQRVHETLAQVSVALQLLAADETVLVRHYHGRTYYRLNRAQSDP